MNEAIDAMLAAQTYAVVGASTNPEKYGNIIYHDLKRHGKTVYAVNPRATSIDGDTCYPTVAALPEVPDVVVAVVPPAVTETLVDEIGRTVKNIWMQEGAESRLAIEKAEANGLNVVAGGPCIMVGLRTHQRR